MQNTLLGLAIAFIVAIGAAFAAPAIVNWDDWRANFENHASALAGTHVRIKGRIQATLLPTPAFTFREVDIGDPDGGSGVRVGEVRGVLALGPLLRGVLEAEEFVLVRPAMQVAADPSEAPVFRAAQTAAAATGLIALSRFSIERGSLVVDRGSDQIILDDIYAEGEMRSRHGPMKIDGVFRRDGRRWGIRANAGQFTNGAGRLRVTLDHAGAGRTFDADGMLSLAAASPRFEGKILTAHRPLASAAQIVPWQIAATARVSDESAVLEGFELALGKDAASTEIAGQIRFQPWKGGRIDGSVSARRIDLDAAAGGDAGKDSGAALAPMREVFALLDESSLLGRIVVSVEALTAGGGTIRDLRAEFGLRGNLFGLNKFEAGLPGRGQVSVTGSAEAAARFSGQASIQAEDGAALARWLTGGKAVLPPDSGEIRASGKLEWTDARLRAEGLEVSLGGNKLSGGITVEMASGAKRSRIAAEISANSADLDLLKPVAEWAHSESRGADVSLALRGNSLRVLGRPLARVNVSLARSGEGLDIERLIVEDFDGLSVRAKGKIAAPIERPSGKIEFELSTARPDGLAGIARELFGEDSARLVRHVAGSGSALKLAGTATGAGSAAGIEVNANGTLGDIDAGIAGTLDLLTETLSEAHITLEARETRSLAILLGFSPGLPAAGNGVLEIDLSKPEGGVLPVNAKLTVPGAEISAEGELRNGKDRLDPNLLVKVAAKDLRYLLAAGAQTGGDRAADASGSFRFSRSGGGFQARDVALKIGDADIKGLLSANDFTRPVVSGKLAISRLEATTLLAAAVGSARDRNAVWPSVRIGPSMFGQATGAIDLEVGELGLPANRSAEKAKFRLRLGANSATVEDFSADLAAGKLSAHANFVRGEVVAFDGRMSLENADVARLLGMGESRSEVRGRGNLTLSLAGSGATPAAIASSLAGQGTISLENLEIDRADPGAVAAVFAMDEKSETRDEISVIAALSPALARDTLKIAKIDAPIVVAAGNARTVKARTSAGPTQITAEANLDVARLTLDAALEMEIEPQEMPSVRPGATLRWRGPLAAIERGIEAAALAGAINLRAMERETKRIEERDGGLSPRTQPAPRSDTNPVDAIPSPQLPESAPVLAPPDPAAPSITIVPSPKARPRSADQPRPAVPPLPPATEIRPAPPVFRP